jgi:hypothetical protein
MQANKQMLSVRVGEGLKQRMKVAVAQRGVTLEEGVAEALEWWLAPVKPAAHVGPESEVPAKSAQVAVQAVKLVSAKSSTRGCRGCGHEVGLHGTFSCSARDCECEGFLS